ncbi:helicase associated domain-containing protein [Streptomyces sp. NPDC005566]|uniref:helicase associated domain-containing protein n=1 Tax=Streptomyces sp. NPDC005566 TaxID=3156886 RepID=UPI0033A3EF99
MFRAPGSPQADGPDQAQDTVREAGWPTSPPGLPLGRWIAETRRRYARGTVPDDRIAQLEKFGMMWSTVDVAWEPVHGLRLGAAVRTPARTAGSHERVKAGIFLKNVRAAARHTDDNEHREVEGLPLLGWFHASRRLADRPANQVRFEGHGYEAMRRVRLSASLLSSPRLHARGAAW